MDFEFTPEQKELIQVVRDFATNVIAKRAAEIDETDQFPRDIISEMGKLGIMGLPIPEEWGGVGADFPSYIAAIEEIAYASAAVGVILAVHTSVGTFPILYFGTQAQKERYLPKLASGEWIGAFALTEPGAGTDAASIRTRAVRQGDKYILNGSKIFITNAGEAGVYCVFAVTDPTKGARGVTAFLVEPGMPGFRVGKKERKMGLNGSNTCELLFEDAEVPVENRLGEEGQGFSIAMRLLDGGRIGIAAQALGIARAAFDAANAHVHSRKQFGQELAGFQGVQFMLADMATKIQAARWLTYHAAALKQQDRKCTREASMAKLFASDTAMQVTTDAVQLFGGYGYIKDFPVERYMRDAKITQIYEGSNQIQRVVIARQLNDVKRI
ncbi:acyl-CoA dehydrogenase [Alicyclobacillus cycloheptanicus]|uniref:Alkylation response protein AidB-like acyl-CoA dehydrogenase n=1 Tax=Alicyclobacillus cycloheptanicus TaxID=1457 RepID=A0ABT9XGN2_9BACL|nr:acyl-CoA dehydrogenase [Alicyclobacillus cycloheptanicus]MDQ0189461.1 alkylation response protein AidB-like acyl-CoA dehydrogenase [Alicyclobacillus cycloheptanicus]WDM02328.1 acyl-CoA dehydrogenase [Alicyclobacillus cycloheptanicus]